MTAEEKPDQSTTDGDDAPSELARQSCWIRRAQRQAEVATENAGDLDGLRTRYEAARRAYGDAWTTATTDVGAAHADLETVRKDLKCKLDKDARSRLDTAWESTKDRLDQCAASEEDHTVPDGKPDTKKTDAETVASLAGRVHDLRVQADQRRTLVEALLKEIDDLPIRVKEQQDEIAALKSEVAAALTSGGTGLADGTAPTTVLSGLYARVLVADWRLGHIHRGFPEVNEYVALVRRALVGLYLLWQAVAILEGRGAYLACLGAASPAGPCAVLLADPVADVLAGATTAATTPTTTAASG